MNRGLLEEFWDKIDKVTLQFPELKRALQDRYGDLY